MIFNPNRGHTRNEICTSFSCCQQRETIFQLYSVVRRLTIVPLRRAHNSAVPVMGREFKMWTWPLWKCISRGWVFQQQKCEVCLGEIEG
ncbi:hypothetical protein Bpfe_025542, partial [Biomphalaria pfeifferi]